MAKGNMTIEEVKEAKIQLEKDIMGLINDFEKKTGVYTTYFDIQRKREKGFDTAVPESKPSREKGKVENVNVNMELDLIY